MLTSRRDFLRKLGAAALAAGVMPEVLAGEAQKKLFFDISLAQWSLHKSFFAKKIDNLDFASIAKNEFDIKIVEYVNQFFKDKAEDTAYLNEMLKRSKDNGVKNHLIMIDGEGYLGDLNQAARIKAVENHYKWVDAAKYLGCKTIRVNAHGEGTSEEVAKAAVDGLSRLGEYAKKAKINVVVENHGGYSSDGNWITAVMREVKMKNVGTLPDFGNFCIKRNKQNWAICEEELDRYEGTKEMMKFAKGVSAKSYDFDANGAVIETDYKRILKVVKDSGFRDIIGIEYEGSKLSEYDGIKATKKALEVFGRMV